MFLQLILMLPKPDFFVDIFLMSSLPNIFQIFLKKYFVRDALRMCKLHVVYTQLSKLKISK